MSKNFSHVSKNFSHASGVFNERSVKERCSVNGIFTIVEEGLFIHIKGFLNLWSISISLESGVIFERDLQLGYSANWCFIYVGPKGRRSSSSGI